MSRGPVAGYNPSRNLAVDFFRGLGLWFLFVDHLEPNFWSHFTPAQLGFSDFAEIFIFLSGYINAGMYRRALEAGGVAAALRKLRTRIARLYGAHIGSMAASFVLLAAFASRGLRLNEPVLYLWMGAPAKYATRTLALLYGPHWYSLLPLYIVLAPFTLLAVIALRRHPRWTLAVSFAIWCIAQSRALDLPVMTRQEAWYFRPLAWQFLFVIGASAEMYGERVRQAADSRILQGGAATIVLVSFLLKTATLIGFVQRWVYGLAPLFVRLLAANAGKARLAPFRLVHFLSLVLLVIVIPWNRKRLLESPFARLAIAAGRDSLFLYCVTLILTAGGNLLLQYYAGGLLLQFACSVSGLAVISGIAYARQKSLRATEQGAEKRT
jgi:hypothetical protein